MKNPGQNDAIEREAYAYDIAELSDKNRLGYLELDEIQHMRPDVILKQVLNKYIWTRLDEELQEDINEEIDKNVIKRNGKSIIHLQTFINIFKKLSLNQLKQKHMNIFKYYHPKLPKSLIKICLWMRIKMAKSYIMTMNGKKSKHWPHLIEMMFTLLELYDQSSDILVLSSLYYHSANNSGKIHSDYSFLFTIRLSAILIPYILIYFSGVQILIHKKCYLHPKFQDYNCFFKLILILNLTILGPFFYIFFRIINVIFVFMKTFGLMLPLKYDTAIRKFIEVCILKIGFEMIEYEGLLEQISISQLLFEDSFVVVLDSLLILGIFKVPGMIEESLTEMIHSLASTTLNIIRNIIIIEMKTKVFEEDFCLYILNCMKAKQDWVPLLNKIKKNHHTNKIIDYKGFKRTLPVLTSYFGIICQFSFEFSNHTIKILCDNINDLSLCRNTNDHIQEISIGECVERVSIDNLALLLSKSINKHIIIDFTGINWNESIILLKEYLHARKSHSESKVGTKGQYLEFELKEPWNGLNSYGESIINLLIESEQNGGHKYKKLLQSLIKEGININLIDSNGYSPLAFAISCYNREFSWILAKNDAKLNETSLFMDDNTPNDLTNKMELLDELSLNNKWSTEIIQSIKLHTIAHYLALYLNKSMHSNCIKTLKLIGLDLEKIRDSEGNNIIHLLLRYSEDTIYSQDLSKIISNNIIDELKLEPNKKGETPLAYTLSIENYNGMKLAKNQFMLKLNLSDKSVEERLQKYCSKLINEKEYKTLQELLNELTHKERVYFIKLLIDDRSLKLSFDGMRSLNRYMKCDINSNTNTITDLESILITEMNEIDNNLIPKSQRNKINLLEFLLNFMLELSCLFDFVTDIIIFYRIILADQTAWVALSGITFVLPTSFFIQD